MDFRLYVCAALVTMAAASGCVTRLDWTTTTPTSGTEAGSGGGGGGTGGGSGGTTTTTTDTASMTTSTTSSSSSTTTTTTTAPNKLVWAKNYGDSTQQRVGALAVDAAGNIIIAGIFYGPIDLGCGAVSLPAGTTSAGYIAKVDTTGKCLWSHAGPSVKSIALDADGSIITAGAFGSKVDFGGMVLTASGAPDAFVAKYTSGGTLAWAKQYGSTALQGADSVAVDSTKNIIVSGTFAGSVNFGGKTLSSSGGSDIFLAKLDTNGGHVWSTSFVGANASFPSHVAIDVGGNAYVTGGAAADTDFGGGPGTSGSTAYYTFLVKYASGGAYQWSQKWTSGKSSRGTGIAVDPSGDVVMSADVTGPIDLGGGVLPGAGENVVLAKFSNAGALKWSKRFGDAAGVQAPASLAVDGSGNVLITGSLAGSIDFGGGTMTATPGTGPDLFLAKLSPSGGYLWAYRYGDGDSQAGTAIGADASGNVYAGGDMLGSIDIGAKVLMSAGNADAFLGKWLP